MHIKQHTSSLLELIRYANKDKSLELEARLKNTQTKLQILGLSMLLAFEKLFRLLLVFEILLTKPTLLLLPQDIKEIMSTQKMDLMTKGFQKLQIMVIKKLWTILL